MLRKAELRERFTNTRKAFDDENKAREKAASKLVSANKGYNISTDVIRQEVDNFTQFFKENPDAPGYFKLLDVDGNTKVGPKSCWRRS